MWGRCLGQEGLSLPARKGLFARRGPEATAVAEGKGSGTRVRESVCSPFLAAPSILKARSCLYSKSLTRSLISGTTLPREVSPSGERSNLANLPPHRSHCKIPPNKGRQLANVSTVWLESAKKEKLSWGQFSRLKMHFLAAAIRRPHVPDLQMGNPPN